MGRFADDVNAHLRDGLAAGAPGFEWSTEYHVAGTPVDVVGVEERGDDTAGATGDAGGATNGDAVGTVVAVELEWRRADPADNAAKLFRHLSEGSLAAGRVVVVHLFTRYYDLASGGVSSKRENAEFVGRVAARTLDALSYHPVTFDLDPPKRGADRPDGWRAAADAAVGDVLDAVGE